MAIANLTIDITAQLAKLQEGLDRAGGLAEKSASRIQSAFAAAGKAAGALGVAAIAVNYASSLRGAIDLADKLDDLGEKYGIAAGALSQYRFAAEVAGTPTEALASGLQKLSKAASEGNNGLKLIGISSKTISGDLKSADTLLLEVADKFSKYEDGAGKAALAQEIFGKSGADMIPLLNKGKAGIQDLRDESVKLGAAFGGDVAKAAGEFNDNMKRLSLAAEGAKVSMFGGLLPAINAFIENIILAKKEFGGFLGLLSAFAKNGGLSGSSSPSDLGNDIAALREKLRLAKEVDQTSLVTPDGIFANGGGNDALIKSLEGKLDAKLKLLEFAKKAQANLALVGSGGVLDANDARAQNIASGKLKAPSIGDAKSAEDAAKKAAEQYAKLIEQIQKRRKEAEFEIANGRQLTDAEKFRIEILEKLNNAESKLGKGQKDRLRTELDIAVAEVEKARKGRELIDLRKRVGDQSAALSDRLIEAQSREAASLNDGNQALVEQVQTYGLLQRSIDALTLSRIDQEIANRRADLVATQNAGSAEQEVQAIKNVIAQLERRRDLSAQIQGLQENERTNPLAGAGRSIEEYLERIGAAGQRSQEVVQGAINSLESSLTSSLAQGKLDVRSFVDFFIQEFLRLRVVQPLVKELIGTKDNPSGLITSMLSIFGFAKGGAFANGQVTAFANGGVVDGPQLFGMRSGLGLMGEAGPEAIMPLRRGRDGKLGVSGGGGVTNVYHVAAGVSRNEMVTALQMMQAQMMGQTDLRLRRAGVV